MTNLVIGDEIYANRERFFNRHIATAAIYNRALSDLEVELYNDSKARYGYPISPCSTCPKINVALSTNGASATQSSNAYSSAGDASLAIDGNTNGFWSGGSVTHTNTETDPWCKVQLQREYYISNIIYIQPK